MSRKLRLPVMIRCAHLKEDRALQDLGRTCVVIEPGAQRDAGTLALLAHSGRGIDWRSQEHKARLIHARAAEEEARVAAVEAKLKLRTLQRADAQRGWSDERGMCG